MARPATTALKMRLPRTESRDEALQGECRTTKSKAQRQKYGFMDLWGHRKPTAAHAFNSEKVWRQVI